MSSLRSLRLALLLILALFLFPTTSVTAPAQGSNSTWARTLTGSNTEGFAATSVQQTRDGGFIVAGATVSPQFLSQTWLLRLDSNGGTIWQKAYGGFSQFVSIVPYGPKTIQATDGGFVVATSTNVTLHTAAAWIFKVDANGGLVWQRAFTGLGNATGTSVVPASDGGFLVFGSTFATVGSGMAFALKLNASGGFEWGRIYTGQGTSTAVFSASRTSDGGSIVSGWTGTVFNAWLLKLDANGGIVWQKTYQGALTILSVQQTSDGGFVGTGANTVLRFDSTGSLIWQKSIEGGATRAVFFSVQQIPDGGFALAGFSGTYPSPRVSLIVRFDSLGSIVWQENFAAGVESQAVFISLTSNGGLAAAGFAFSTSSISNAWVLKLDARGVIHHCASLSTSALATNEVPSSQVSITGSSSDISTGLTTTTFASTTTPAGSLALCQHGFKV
jgi:hypothetical protein